MKHLFTLGLLFLGQIAFTQQHYTGYTTDNNAGHLTVFNQPASIVNTKTKFSIGTSSAFYRTNNYIGTNFNLIFNPINTQTQKLRNNLSLGYRSSNLSVNIIGLKYEINHDNAIGYNLRFRNFKNREGLAKELGLHEFNNFNSPELVGTGPITIDKMNFNRFVYLEHMFNYARVIVNKNEKMIKAGVAFKIINGINADYTYITGQTNFPQAQVPTFTNTEINYGKAGNASSLDDRHNGFGLDLGVVYEYRPDYRDYIYEMDGIKNIDRYNESKYKYKIGASITDIGWVKFNRDTANYDFTTTIPIPYDQKKINPLIGGPSSYINNTLLPLGTKNAEQKDYFRMNLPTSLNIQFDYLVVKYFYLNYSSATALKFPKDKHKVHQKAIHTITPRLEKDMFSIMLPISLQRNAQLNVGLTGRYQFKNINVFVGSNNVTFLFGKRTIYNNSIYGGLNYSIPYTVPSDIDGDKISDPFDDCVYDPGSIEMKGCPDTDGDGIPDKNDYCIYDAGPKSTFGCPDRDNDGVIDLNDQCPDDAGLAIHYGCPDSDKDGVIDVADQCPDVPGVELNNGCPFEITNCCLDDDGDTVPNSSDKCPTIPGSVYNSGCPIDENNINTINLNEAKDSLDPNHTVQYVDQMPNKDTSMVENTQQVLEDFRGNNQVSSLVVYFETDDATIIESYQSMIKKMVDENNAKNLTYVVIGHADNRGSETHNLLLSKKRADVVKRTLINKGIPESQIIVYYYGEWKPTKSNNNIIEHKFNRRVDVRVMEK